MAAGYVDRYIRRMKTILAPIDLSQVSEAVVAQAATLARGMSGQVVLLSVIQPPVITAEYTSILENIAEINAAGEKNAQRKLAQIQEKLMAEGVTADTLVLVGSPVPHIVEQADLFNADYIVMGSHGHTALYDLIVGSTTHGVLMRAKCPVVIVPSAKGIKHRLPHAEHAEVA